MFHRPQFSTLYFLLVLLISSSSALPSSIWHVSIFEGPAPSPEDGPPLSASALRDPSYLPVQIGSIVGAYIFFVIVIAVALLLVGRRLRRAAQASPRTLAMEMMRPFKSEIPKSFDPSPITPATNNPYGPSPVSALDMKSSWPSPGKTKSGSTWTSFGKGHNKQPSMQSSVVTFDESVIEDDRTKNQQEMDRLYAAVMEHDEQKSTSRVDLAGQNITQHPPELQHLRQDPATQPVSPVLSRSDTKSPTRITTASPRKQTKPSPITIHSRASSRSSLGSFGKRRGIRNLPISPPMGSPDLVPEHVSIYGESEPLSPRMYEPGPPPPTPPSRQYDSIPENRQDTSRLSPRHAGFLNFHRTPRTAAPTTERFAEPVRQFEEPPASQGDNHIPLRDFAKQKRTPAPLALRTGTSTSTNTQQLPLRSAPLPLRNPNPVVNRPTSTIKATVLERNTSDLRGPRTGVPSTPYSPYMPFTPLTPMTPSRLVTKQERKRREKEEGRRVVTVEDAVIEEADMWGDAYP